MTCDNRGMAATVEEGTAPKLVLVNAGKQFPIASVNRDSRKDGSKFDNTSTSYTMKPAIIITLAISIIGWLLTLIKAA